MDPDETARMRRLIWIHAGRKRLKQANNLSFDTKKISNNMKPTQVLEKSSSATKSFQTEVRGKQLGRRTAYMLVGAVVFVLVVGAVLLSVSFGMKMAKDSYKEYHANCIRDDGSVVHENIIMTDKEEIFSNDVATGIADMSTDLLTIKIKEAGPHFGKCYVTNFNFSEFQTPQEFIRTHKNSQITIETKNVVKRFYDVTDIWLNNKVLGTNSAKLCEGKPAFFLHERKDLTTRTKRSACPIFLERLGLCTNV